MLARSRGTRESLLEAVVHLVARGGPEAATTQAIARHVGITEGAIYRHFRSKEELRWAAYRSIVLEMIAEKEQLAARDGSLRELVERWVRLTYQFFDQHPEAFIYIFLRPHPELVDEADRDLVRRQGRIFMQWVEDRQARGEVRRAEPEILLSHFTGLMLNVPRLIEEGTLDGPAEGYSVEVANTICRALRPAD